MYICSGEDLISPIVISACLDTLSHDRSNGGGIKLLSRAEFHVKTGRFSHFLQSYFFSFAFSFFAPYMKQSVKLNLHPFPCLLAIPPPPSLKVF